MKEKFVSIVVTLYNRRALMKKTAESVLRSDYRNYELIAVDGGSTDGSLEMLRDMARKNRKLKVFVDKTPGRNPARNTGIRHAKGEIIIFIDSDVVVEKDWIKEIVRPFADAKVGGVIGRTIADRKGLFWYHMENKYIQFIGHNSAYRTRLVKGLGGFDRRFFSAKEDTDMAFRIMEQGYEVVYCDKARMTHISKRASPLFRVRNQRHYVYDGLLWKKHPKLYRKYFFDKNMPSPLWPAILSVPIVTIFLYSLIFYRILAVCIMLAYIIVTAKKLAGSRSGTVKEKTLFLLSVWLLPLSRVYYFTKGYMMFRGARA